jgi:phenylalanyl-tRNA synthetase alpha chain
MMGDETAGISQAVASIERQFDAEAQTVAATPSPDVVEQLRLTYLGRKGLVTGLLESLRNCSKDERPAAGKAINLLKQKVEKSIDDFKGQSLKWATLQKLAAPALDISLPVASQSGSLHPVTLMRRELCREFRRMGFTVYDGPELDFEFYNFNSLNIPENHPARDMQDTFYAALPEVVVTADSVLNGAAANPKASDALGDPRPPLGRLLLRTHTSNLQIHAMLADRPPLRIVAPGRVFRVDSDPTHTPMFHQIEALVVDRGINFGHLKGVIATFMKALFGSSMKTRLRPSYFPFVEPGAEIDIQCVHCGGKGCRICKNTGWVEVGGAGMIHPNVFEAVDLDSEIYTGFAFGFGIDRMAMMKYKVPDLRQLFEGNVSYLSQYPVVM